MLEKNNNIGYYCSTHQCIIGNADRTAIISINNLGKKELLSYKDIDNRSNQFANFLKRIEFSKGDVFFSMLPKMPEQTIAFLGCLKAEVIIGCLFTNFGEDAIFDRLQDSKAKGIIIRKNLLQKILNVKTRLPNLKYVIVVDKDENSANDVLNYQDEIEKERIEFQCSETNLTTPSVLHYTSGSTGKPKGVLHKHQSLRSQIKTSEQVLLLNKDDIYWCTADPGWVTGTSYGIIGPLSIGVTSIYYDGGFSPQTWMEILINENVTCWYTSPTALRMLMQNENINNSNFDFKSLKNIFAVGEPLNPEILNWAREKFKKEVYDTYFQTETGAIMISNNPLINIRPGSMGKPVNDITAMIIDKNGNEAKYNEVGALCFKSGWDSMFSEYLNNPDVYNEKFKNGMYYTGDLAYKTDDGYFWFVGRNDDVINTAGHLVSPFEVESAILEMEDVLDVAVIAAKDDVLFEKVVAFVKLKAGIDCKDYELKIRLFVSKRVSSIATPKDIVFTDNIPKNKSGKIMRRYIKAIYEGNDPGDISTIEN